MPAGPGSRPTFSCSHPGSSSRFGALLISLRRGLPEPTVWNWWRVRDLNPEPTDYDLCDQLKPELYSAQRAGIDTCRPAITLRRISVCLLAAHGHGRLLPV